MTSEDFYRLLTAILLQWTRDAKTCAEERADLQHFLGVDSCHMEQILSRRIYHPTRIAPQRPRRTRPS